MITVLALNQVSGLRHGFFTREGGVSDGILASLNCGFGSQDDPAKVKENRARAMRALDCAPESLTTCYQEHTPTVVRVEAPWPHDKAPVADALVTKQPGIALGILTADCAPVLLARRDGQVVGAAHAGWKGALGGVLENTVAALGQLGAKPADLIAAIGPCIGPRSYEVGPDFPAPFLAENPDNQDFFAPGEGDRLRFDLPGYVARKLARLGVGEVAQTPCDTFREESRFFSYRRACVRGEKQYGRALSAIVIRP